MLKKIVKNLIIAMIMSTVMVLTLSLIAMLIVETVPYTGNLLLYLFMGVGFYFIAKHWRD